MALEGTGRGELAQLVTDHIFGDVNGHMLAAVVHGEGVAHKVGENRGGAAPGFSTRFSPAAFISCTRFSRTGRTYGPFLTLLPMFVLLS